MYLYIALDYELFRKDIMCFAFFSGLSTWCISIGNMNWLQQINLPRISYNRQFANAHSMRYYFNSMKSFEIK